MKKQVVVLVILLALVIAFGIVISRLGHQDNIVGQQIEVQQEGIDRVASTAPPHTTHKEEEEATSVETQEEVEREIHEIIDHIVALNEPEQDNATDEDEDPVAKAWKHLEDIAQNPQNWGDLSPEATELIEQLTPTWSITNEGKGEEAIELLDRLTQLRDPRSPEIFVNYHHAGTWGAVIEEALIAVGPPSVLPLISLLDDNNGFLGRKRAAKLLGIIASEHRQDLGGAVEYIILPKLEKLATSDPHPRVRQYASEAVSQLR